MNIGALLGLDFDVPLWLLLLLGNLVAYYVYMTWHFGTFKKMGIDGPKPVPVLGNLNLMFKRGIRDNEIENVKQYGKLYGFFWGRTPSLTVADPDVLKQVLVKEFPHFINRQKFFVTSSKSNIMSKALTNIRDDHWKHVRASLTPTFSAGKLKLMQKQIAKVADQLVAHIGRESEKDAAFEAKEFASCFTMDVIAYTTYGIELDCQNDPENAFVRMNKTILNVSLKSPQLMLLFFLPFLGKILSRIFPIIPHDISSFFFKLTTDAVNRRKESENKQNDFVQLMAEALTDEPTLKDRGKEYVRVNDIGDLWSTKGLTETEIAGNSMLFIFAGYETTSATLSFAMYCLAVNPGCQEKLIKEIDTKIQGQEPKYDDIAKMDYLQQVIDETLRLYPPAPRLERVVEEDITINGIHFPKGIQVGVPVIVLHMNPDVWPEPEKFDPERFTDEAKAERDSYYYLPFGQGPRNCIGMRLALLEMKIALIKMLQKYRLVPCDKTQIPLKLKKMRINAEDGIWLKTKPRDYALES